MFGSAMLDVAIGLVTTYLLLGLTCSTLNEFVARVTRLRAKALRQGVRDLLGDAGGSQMSRDFYQHPLIKGLAGGPDGNREPNWIPPQIFSAVVLELAGFGAPGAEWNVTRTVDQIKNDHIRRSLQALAISAGDDAARLRLRIEEWFNAGMSQVTEWYKRRTQLIVLVLALVVCSALNVDTIAIIRSLSQDPAMRASVVAAAGELSQRKDLGTRVDMELQELRQIVNDSGLPIGWRTAGKQWGAPQDPRGWVAKILGIALSVISVSLGAPFWFDVLNKLVKLRGSREAKET